MLLDPHRKERLLNQVSTHLQQRPEILFAFAHGSFIGQGPFRDLDIAVFLEPDFIKAIDFRYEMQLESEIEKDLKTQLSVDVRILNTSPLSFRYHALRGRLLLDRNADARVAFMAQTAARYLDIEPILKDHTREAFAVDSGS